MSDERLEALGLPRREFLKRAAIGVFAAPVIVSFGLAGTAEAAPGCFPNQTFANQASAIGDTVLYIWQLEQSDRVESGFASVLRRKFLDCEAKLLDGDYNAVCKRLDELAKAITREFDRKIESKAANTLLSFIDDNRSELGCVC